LGLVCRHPARPQQSAQAKGNQEVECQQDHRECQQRRAQCALRRHCGVILDPSAGHRCGRLGRRQVGAEVQRAPAVLRSIQPRRVTRRDGGAGDLACRQAGRGLQRRGQQPVAIQRFGRRQDGVVGDRCHARRQCDEPAQHVHEQAGQRQIGPVGIGGDVEQHDASRPPGSLGDQRSAVGQRRPGVGTKVSRRFREHLAVDLHLLRNGQASERRAGAELRHARRLRPGQRPAELTVTPQQLDRHQRIRLADRLLGGARACEADQQPAMLHPLGQRVAIGPVGQWPVGKDQHRDLALQQRGEIGFADLGVRRQRAAKVKQRTGEWRIGSRQVTGEDSHRPPPPALIEQHHGCSAWRPLQHESAQPVAQLGRQRDRGAGFAGTGRKI
jgi:hypothetical protein